jgi:2-dehydro-3-deoxyphosphogluconate aldolase/(4S)-4-hydroxy-2-oxoglutarate aldolase
MNISEILLTGPVMPVIVIDDADLAVPLGEALLSGGINAIEVTLRTDAALNSIERLAKELPEICVGAGTILTEINAHSAANAGARFAVSPGTTHVIIDACKAHNLPLLPGASTVSEMLTLHEAGFTAMKFFPAEAAGGAQFIKSLASPLPHLQFCPTGGITYDTASSWLALANVPCVGGSWLAPAHDINQQNFSMITERAKQASTLERP